MNNEHWTRRVGSSFSIHDSEFRRKWQSVLESAPVEARPRARPPDA